MYDQEVDQIIALLQEGQEAEARTVFMKHLLDHCRALDQMLGVLCGWEPTLSPETRYYFRTPVL